MSGRNNEFLKQFVEMRKGIAPGPMAASTVLPQSKKGKKISKAQVVTDSGLQRIMEEKPPRKDVEEYLQKRCHDLTNSKMC
jgi:hypothetical protein